MLVSRKKTQAFEDRQEEQGAGRAKIPVTKMARKDILVSVSSQPGGNR